MMENNNNTIEEINVTAKVSKEEKQELIEASKDKNIVKYLVDQYYQSQAYRIMAQNQTRALVQGFDKTNGDEQPQFISKELNNAIAQEALNKKYMDIITEALPICRWMKSIIGIGPVFSAYLYSVFEVSEGRYATDFLSYAGLNDNNNPWLGNEKARKLTNEAMVKQNDKLNKDLSEIKKIFINENGGDEKKFDKFITKCKTLYKKQNSISSAEMDQFAKEILKSEIFISMEQCVRYRDLDDIFMSIIDPKYVSDTTLDYIAARTKRKISIIKAGVKSLYKDRKNKQYCTESDLVAYLAKPPYNLDLKKRCFLIGESFMKVSGKEDSLYGQVYRQRKIEETRRNENGEFRQQAESLLASKNYDKTTDTYKCMIEGKLSPAHIHARAKRYAVKLFISHVYEAMYYAEFHKDAPQHYVISHMGHHDYIAPEVDYKPYIDNLI